MQEFDPIQPTSSRVKKCPQCGSRSDTIYQKEASYLTYVLSLASMFFFQFWSIFIIPAIIAATQQVAKRCYDCDAIIEKHNLFSLPSMSDQILNFRFGSFAFIVSRKYAYIILSLIVLFFVYTTIIKEPSPVIQVQEDLPKGVIELNVSWEDFLNECGSQVFLDNSVRANSHYMQTYHENNVRWEGEFVQCNQCPRDFKQMRANSEFDLGIKMNPTDSSSLDLVLRVGYSEAQQNLKVFENLKQHDIIQFTGNFIQLGGERFPHILILKAIKSTDKNIQEISSDNEGQN